MEDGEEGDEGKRRKNASQQRYMEFWSAIYQADVNDMSNNRKGTREEWDLDIPHSSTAPLSFLILIISAKAKNREHAKNTRIRKKHYIEALKESLKLLFDEREKIDKDRRNSLSRLAEQVTKHFTDKLYSNNGLRSPQRHVC